MLKKVLLVVFVIISIEISAQTTLIPDPNFEQALIDLGYDVGVPDGVVLTANIDVVTSLEVSFSNISDLTGIENFTSLTTLKCNNNQLDTIDVSQNIALVHFECMENQLVHLVTQNPNLVLLWCGFNQLDSIDISQNPALRILECHNNQLIEINLTQNTELDFINCQNNLMTRLNVSQNSVLAHLYCQNNYLTCLDLKNGNNPNFMSINTLNNANLNCINVDNVSYSTTNWTGSSFAFDAQISYSATCANSCSPIGLEENSLAKLSISPNPSNGLLTISFENNSGVNYTITTLDGRIVLEGETREKSINVNLTNESNGIYFLKIDENNTSVTYKLIKQ